MSNRSNNPLFIRSAFNNTPVALAVIDEQGLFFEVNEKFCSVFGYTSAELIHQPFLSFFSESTQQELVAVQQAILHDGQSVQNISCKGKSKTRQSIDLLASFNSFGDESGNRYIITSLTDISFQKQKMEEAESINLQYRSVIEHSIHAFFLAKPDGTIVDANNAAEKMFGYSVEELCAIGRDAIIDNTDPKTQQKLTERAHNGFATGELTGIRKNGERFSFEFSSVKFAGVNGEETTSTLVHDISERKQQEHKLLRSQDEMALILNNTEEMFMVIDKDWNVINYNKATKERAKSILGKELTMGDSLLSLAEPERYSYVKAVYEKVLNEITQNQQLLQQAESIAHVGSWELDVVTDKLFWSDEVFRICGYEPKSFQLTVESGWAVIHPDDRTAFITGLQKAIVGKTNCASDLRFVRPGGTIRYIKSKAKVVLDKERKAVRLIGVFHDVTDQKLMERELAISQQQYKSLFEQNPDAVVSFDLQGNIISVNDAGML
ncbi:MAG TPA: PAS domain S-box protein, partial [Lacibacter sp.]|nr:PAS domain S-box protein [Lacibacter sp.]